MLGDRPDIFFSSFDRQGTRRCLPVDLQIVGTMVKKLFRQPASVVIAGAQKQNPLRHPQFLLWRLIHLAKNSANRGGRTLRIVPCYWVQFRSCPAGTGALGSWNHERFRLVYAPGGRIRRGFAAMMFVGR